MATVHPQPSTASEPTSGHRSPWLWVSVALAVVAVALGAWALKTKSDLDDANQKNATLQAEIDKAKQSPSTVTAALQTAVSAAASQLGVSAGDVDAAKQQIADAKAQAQQGVDAAKANATLAAGCARAYLGTLAGLFQSGDIRGQVPATVSALQSLTGDCKSALSGSS
jgi:hypothetical protein